MYIFMQAASEPELTQTFGCSGVEEREKEGWAVQGPGPLGTVTLLADGSRADGQGGVGGAA